MQSVAPKRLTLVRRPRVADDKQVDCGESGGSCAPRGPSDCARVVIACPLFGPRGRRRRIHTPSYPAPPPPPSTVLIFSRPATAASAGRFHSSARTQGRRCRRRRRRRRCRRQTLLMDHHQRRPLTSRSGRPPRGWYVRVGSLRIVVLRTARDWESRAKRGGESP